MNQIIKIKQTKVWHSLDLNEVYNSLESSSNGLTAEESRERIKQYGLNKLNFRAPKNIFLVFLFQFKSPLIYALLLAAFTTYFLEHSLDTYVILFVVISNAIFGVFHEFKADRAVEALEKMISLETKVKRDGVVNEINADQVVPGDIVEIEAGSKIPADLRIIEQNNLRVDESTLTGESIAREKRFGNLDEHTNLADRTNMLYAGTFVISGNAIGIVVETGKNTQFGSIAEQVATVDEEETPLQKNLAIFSKKLIIIILFAVFAIFLIGVFKGLDLIQMFLTAVSAAVSAIPEGLPAIITITLATGAIKMSARRAVTRKLNAVETLGSITAIASDKTGTLTYNEMMITKVFSAQDDQEFVFSGSGYGPKGKIAPDITPELKNLLEKSVICCDAEIYEKDNTWQINGDPTEGAIVAAASKIGLAKSDLTINFPRLSEIPFETENGYMATISEEDDKNILVVKGKIEVILKMSNLADELKKKYLTKMEEFASSALRVIAVASKEVPKNRKDISADDLMNLDFLGLLGMIDPPREEVYVAIEVCQTSGIRTLMLTGDHLLTARAIGYDLKMIKSDREIIDGQRLEKLSESEFLNVLNSCSVFARISPTQKLQIVSGLQKLGHIVAVTGDGINDAPALKKADIGVAMGDNGTDVSKEVSDLILVDNNFATIVAAIEEGRTVFQNIRRAVFYLLSTNIGELVILLSAIIFLPPVYQLPLLPVQILWLNLVTDGTAGLALALEPTHSGVIKYRPRSPKEGILDSISFWRIIIVSAVMLAVTFILYIWEINHGASIERARSIAFVSMSILQIFNMLNARSMKKSIFQIKFFSNIYILVAFAMSIILTYLTVSSSLLRSLFSTVELGLIDWVKIVIISLSIIVVVEIEKIIRRINDEKNK